MNQARILKLKTIKNEINQMLMESDAGIFNDIRSFMGKKPEATSSFMYCMKGLASKLASGASSLSGKLKFWHMESEGDDEPEVQAKKISELAKGMSDMINDAIKKIGDTFTKADAMKMIGLALAGSSIFVVVTIVIYNQSSGKSFFSELAKASESAMDSGIKSVNEAFSILTDGNKDIIERLAGFFKELILAPFKSIIAGTSSLEDSNTISLTAAISSGVAIGIVSIYYIGRNLTDDDIN